MAEWVIDASAGLALVLSEQEGPGVASIVEECAVTGARILVPSLFWYELGNGLLSAVRSTRVSSADAASLIDDLRHLPIDDDDSASAGRLADTYSLADRNNLTFYDATYLELALRAGARLKTFDRHLLALKSQYEFIS